MPRDYNLFVSFDNVHSTLRSILSYPNFCDFEIFTINCTGIIPAENGPVFVGYPHVSQHIAHAGLGKEEGMALVFGYYFPYEAVTSFRIKY